MPTIHELSDQIVLGHHAPLATLRPRDVAAAWNEATDAADLAGFCGLVDPWRGAAAALACALRVADAAAPFDRSLYLCFCARARGARTPAARARLATSAAAIRGHARATPVATAEWARHVLVFAALTHAAAADPDGGYCAGDLARSTAELAAALLRSRRPAHRAAVAFDLAQTIRAAVTRPTVAAVRAAVAVQDAYAAARHALEGATT